MSILSTIFAAARDGDESIDFSALGALLGLVLAAVAYIIGHEMAKRYDSIWRPIGVIVAIAVFLVCAFDVAGFDLD